MGEAIVQNDLRAETERESWWESWRKDPKRNRLRAALCGHRQELQGMLTRPSSDANVWWADCARHSLEAAEAAMERCDYDGAWGALHDARRFMVFGMDGPELLLMASALDAETTAKLKGWRLKAANGLLRHVTSADWAKTPSALTPDRQTLVRHVVSESLSLLNGHSDNLYHRLGLVGLQLNYLVVWCAVLIGLALVGSYLFAPADPMLQWGHLAAVGLAGALGGVVSAMIQLSRVGETKIPDALMHGLITSGRPLVGAASALFIYAVMHSGVISIIDAPANVAAGLVLGFAAGFSDQFVLGAIAKVAGKSSGGDASVDELDNGPGRDKQGRANTTTSARAVPESATEKQKREAPPSGNDVPPGVPTDSEQSRQSKARHQETTGETARPAKSSRRHEMP